MRFAAPYATKCITTKEYRFSVKQWGKSKTKPILQSHKPNPRISGDTAIFDDYLFVPATICSLQQFNNT